MTEHELVADARAALDRLARTAPVATLVETARAELDDELRRTPMLVGVEGSDGDRAALLDLACGGLLGPIDRISPCAAIRVRRGDAIWFRAVGFDGRIEEARMPASASDPGPEPVVAPPLEPSQVEQLERELPRLVRIPPPWWAIWLWPIRWLLRWLARDKLARIARARAALPGASPLASDPEPFAIESRDLDDTPERFLARLRELASGRGRGDGIRGILLEVVDPTLPHDLEVVELIDKPYVDKLDVVVESVDRDVYLDHDGDRGQHIGGLAEAIARLPLLARTGRAARVGARALGAVRAAVSALDVHVDAAEAGFRARIGALEALRIGDRPALVAAQLAAMRPQVMARVTQLLERLVRDVGAALAQLETIWVDELTSASSTDELKATLVRIHDGSPKSVASIIEGTKRLAVSDLAGAVHDLHPELIAVLYGDHGLPESHPPSALVVPPAELAMFQRTPQWTFERGGSWLAGLFRSFDARRSEALAKMRQGAAALRELALAELLDVEPALHSMLTGALSSELAHAIDHQVAWLDATVAREQAAVAREREALEPLRQLRLAADADAQRLVETLRALTGS